MTAEQEREALVARYKAAYRRANGYPYPYDVSFHRGWFTLHSGSIGAKKRFSQLAQMADTLESRPAHLPTAEGEKA